MLDGEMEDIYGYEVPLSGLCDWLGSWRLEEV